ncbi:carboxylic ester hydrolase [Actinoallomurus iriomotensis]|uniref:Carboxylic ester hydrolase n=2 Tax=Actinoallomurus iriomotensis TaxID=478107 RepID=A0A9W6RWP1_9ACTN|nr:carboxylic ester hydrolase [Actinoallomurus iriomotensis]
MGFSRPVAACTFTVVTFAAMACSPTEDASARAGLVAGTQSGKVRGSESRGVKHFQGIPFAGPPTGKDRWEAPRPPVSWSGVRNATDPGSACPQEPTEQPRRVVEENCLYLNVTAPRSDRTRKKPVIVFLYGGGFTAGEASKYKADQLVRQGDVVAVTANYRVGVFGFLGLPGLKNSGSFGILDQQAALRWVRRNIAAFGGDPENVTLAGQSAGGISTCINMMSPGADELFDKAVIHSGPCTNTGNGLLAPVGEVEKEGKKIERELGCSSLACMRSKSAVDLLDAVAKSHAAVGRVAYGTPTLPTRPDKAVQTGRIRSMPVLVGSTRDDGTLAASGLLPLIGGVTHDSWPAVLKGLFAAPDDIPKITRRYPVRTKQEGTDQFTAVQTDWGFSCPAAAMRAGAASRMPVYGFEFADRKAPKWPGLGERMPSLPLGAYHASDLNYLFDMPTKLQPDQNVLSREMIEYWMGFMYHGNPNHPGLPAWPSATQENGSPVLSLAPGSGGIKPVDASSEHNCALWNHLGRH